MDYNYHTHTKRCSHATGEMEEYIQRAIACGIKYMGFSEHAPYVSFDGTEAYYRLPVSQVQDYFSEIGILAEKYKNQIEISVGFEMEYYPKYFKTMLENCRKAGAQYLILGEHFLNDKGKSVYVKTKNKTTLKTYVSRIVRGIKTGVYTYVAHPDIMRFTGDGKIYAEEMRKICIASRECFVPLEINFLGIRQKRDYPNEFFWKVAGEEKCPVTFGFDAHDTDSAYDDKSLERAMELVRKYNLNYIGKPQLKNIINT